jgi:hypothetical protein
VSGFGIIGRVLWTGTKNTAWRIWWWQAAYALEGRQRAGGVVLRFFGSLALAWFAGGVLWVTGALPYVLPMVWFVSAGILGGDSDEAVVDGGESAERPEHDDVARALHALTGDRNGVHLSAVAARLNVEQSIVRELLDEMEVRHKSVKIKGVGVAVGVSKKDLPPLPSPLAEEDGSRVAGSAAGQSATATATSVEFKSTEKGVEAWIKNPLNPAETHIFRSLGQEAS